MFEYLHIVSFDIPFPPNYGGVIDVYYLIEELKNQNISVILHCYHRDIVSTDNHIDKIQLACHKIYYYQRNMELKNFFSALPFTVKTRPQTQLLANLLKDEHPILFFGLFCCQLAYHPKLQKRIKIMRACNVEHNYFWELGKAETNLKKKIYYTTEAVKLKFFEKKVVPYITAILPVSRKDESYFHSSYPSQQIIYTPSFHKNDFLEMKKQSERYVLYHGNLALAENIKAATFIIKKIAASLPFVPFIIAGRQPAKKIVALAQKYDNVLIIPDPDKERMNELLAQAHVHLLYTFQATGLKLKIINVLFTQGHVLVNEKMVSGSELDSLCYIANGATEIAVVCKKLFDQPIQNNEWEKRKKLISDTYNNAISVKRMLSKLSSI